jgi:hypothetical protein
LSGLTGGGGAAGARGGFAAGFPDADGCGDGLAEDADAAGADALSTLRLGGGDSTDGAPVAFPVDATAAAWLGVPDDRTSGMTSAAESASAPSALAPMTSARRGTREWSLRVLPHDTSV